MCDNRGDDSIPTDGEDHRSTGSYLASAVLSESPEMGVEHEGTLHGIISRRTIRCAERNPIDENRQTISCLAGPLEMRWRSPGSGSDGDSDSCISNAISPCVIGDVTVCNFVEELPDDWAGDKEDSMPSGEKRKESEGGSSEKSSPSGKEERISRKGEHLATQSEKEAGE